MTDPSTKSDAEWRQQLNPQAYRVLREAATDPPFRSPFHDDFSGWSVFLRWLRIAPKTTS